jgi:CRISPR/Cas system-associated endonuclease Cas1
MHGKTHRGALVFDIADLIKDAIVLPWAFISAKGKPNLSMCSLLDVYQQYPLSI